MKGIEYVVDARGRRKAVLVDLKVHGDAWEDFYDALVARLRANEPRETYSSVRSKLKAKGKVRA
ncbi:MAG: hypothetical protein F9K22_05430 [Bacteroidetes bacterium]|nr:MAG: hypothetical protein F9K22_05430 [Bacteroidota bacterium]